MLTRVKTVAALAIFLASGGQLLGAQTALDDYIAKPDPNYSYDHYHTDNKILYKTYFLTLVSQQWRTASEVDRPLWEHDLAITVPALLHSPSKRTVLLLINGGANGRERPKDTEEAMSLLALATGSVVAVVSQIPNEPLSFSDEGGRARTEDEILAYSLDKYLDTRDPEWPVHLAMTKAAVRAMDTIQGFLDDRSVSVDDFIVVGGSKRGWTAWLTAAVDPRVKAVVPISIDLLNLRKQFEHHKEAYGFYAPAIGDYVEFDLPCRIYSRTGRELLRIIDPYHYWYRYTMPKLVINSAGDQFFLPDSSQFYFRDLPGPKALLYTVNTDHGQGDDPSDLVVSALLWIDDVLHDRERPKYTWTFEDDNTIRVQAIFPQPEEVFLWQAHNPTDRDFRLETIGPAWTKTRLEDSGGGLYVGRVEEPPEGFTAYTVELIYEEKLIAGLVKTEHRYTTDVRVIPDLLPFEGEACRSDSAVVEETP